MDEVNVETVDVRLELIELVEPPLLRAPVERVAPVGDELLEIRQIRSVVPAGSVEAVRGPERGDEGRAVRGSAVAAATLSAIITTTSEVAALRM